MTFGHKDTRLPEEPDSAMCRHVGRRIWPIPQTGFENSKYTNIPLEGRGNRRKKYFYG